jgi:hypothetical protein
MDSFSQGNAHNACVSRDARSRLGNLCAGRGRTVRRQITLARAMPSRVVDSIDAYQRGHRWAGFPLAVAYSLATTRVPT